MKYFHNLWRIFLIIFISIILWQIVAIAATVNIAGYDIHNAVKDGFGGWGHIYTGTITDTGNVVAFDEHGQKYSGTIAEYSGGGGTLNDDYLLALTNSGNTQLFATYICPEITIYFDQYYFIDDITLFGHEDIMNVTIPGNITGFDITANTTTTFNSEPLTIIYPNRHEYVDLTDSEIDNIAVDRIVLSNFTTEGGDDDFFCISEIVLTGRPVPIPGAVWLLGSGLIGIVGIRRRFNK